MSPIAPGNVAHGSARPAGLLIFAAILLAYAVLATTSERPPAPMPDEADVAPTFSAVDSLGDATAFIERGQARETCIWQADDQRFACGDQVWNAISPYAGRADGRPVRCLWMHPSPDRGTKVIEWPAAPIGSHLRARLALLDSSNGGARVDLRVLVGGQRLLELKESHKAGIERAEVSVPAGAARDRLRIEVVAENHDWRHACVQVEMTGKRTIDDRPTAAQEPAKTPRLVAPAMRKMLGPLALPSRVTPTIAPTRALKRASRRPGRPGR